MFYVRRVGVRELKQNASAVLKSVKAGEAVEVTERGRPVALIVPVPESDNVVDRLVAEGRARAAVGNLSEFPPPVPADPESPLPSEALRALRSEER